MNMYRKNEIEQEYDSSSLFDLEYEKVKWGSAESMHNRFNLVTKMVDFREINKWLDIGAGTGAFQVFINSKFPHVKSTGLDLSSKLIDYAKNRSELSGTRNYEFRHLDFLDFRETEFDLLTTIGVLQKTNMSLTHFFEHAFKCLRKDGILFIDTKNSTWEKFYEPGFTPEKNHSWFAPSDLISIAKNCGFKNIQVYGFIPNEDRVVKTHKSHTFFLIANK